MKRLDEDRWEYAWANIGGMLFASALLYFLIYLIINY